MYALIKDNEIISKHETKQEAYYKLQRVQSFSADWAMKHEGYEIIELAKTSNSKKVKQAVRDHILEMIDQEDETFKNDKERLKYLIDRFNSEYVHAGNIKRYGKGFDLFKEWVQAASTNLYFEYYKILEFMKSIGMPKPINVSMEQAANKYYQLVYRELNALLDSYGMELYHAGT